MEIQDISKLIIDFRDKRNWEQFHQVKDLLLGLDIEVSELMELFLWKSDSEIAKIPKEIIENELADIFIFLTYVADKFNINLEESVVEKIKINDQKYPVSKSFGSNKKYNEL
ncbi:MAG: nucleotide pyrophosphohydrolase [Anaerolineaceae bacterium]